MSKGFQSLYNIFSRNKSKLETDAVPTAYANDQQEELSNTNSSFGSIPPDSQSNLALIEHSRVPTESSVELFNPITNPATNNLLAVNHTQGQVVNQFSHINKLHLGSTYYFNAGGNAAANGGCTGQKKPKTRTVDAMLRSQERLSHRMLTTISMHLGERWQFVMRELEFSDAQIHQHIVDYKIDGGIKEVIYQLLLDWTRNDDNATLGKITNILWKLEHYETVKYMKLAWKEEKSKLLSEEPTSEI